MRSAASFHSDPDQLSPSNTPLNWKAAMAIIAAPTADVVAFPIVIGFANSQYQVWDFPPHY